MSIRSSFSNKSRASRETPVFLNALKFIIYETVKNPRIFFEHKLG